MKMNDLPPPEHNNPTRKKHQCIWHSIRVTLFLLVLCAGCLTALFLVFPVHLGLFGFTGMDTEGWDLMLPYLFIYFAALATVAYPVN